MQVQFPHLFSPITVNHMELKNRIVMTAMHLGYARAGEVTDSLLHFYVRRAEGDVALIIVGGCPIDDYAGMGDMLSIHEDRYIPGLRRLTHAVREKGAKIAAQLYQPGRYAHSSMIGGRKPLSASSVRSTLTGETPRAMDLEEIWEVQEKFARAALRAKESDFDAIEILGSAGYLISQFLSPLTNRREDQYGGSLENRMRFGREVVEKVRKAAGPNYPVLMRIAGHDFMKGGNTNHEARIFAAELEKTGVDLFNVTGGWHETRVPQLSTFVPRGAYSYLARGVKSAVHVPVLASNRINDPHIAEELILQGEADLVAMARGLLADPDLPRKSREGRSRLLTHCVACNQGCFDSIFQFRPVTCLVNPSAGKEREVVSTPAPEAKNVLVIGGGPAGMKAAVMAAGRGHRVLLVEKEHRLGGQLLLNERIPGRQEMVTAAMDLIRQLRDLDVRILLGREADLSLVEKMAPDAVVVATGAKPALPEIPGVDSRNVVLAWELLAGKIRAGDRVVIVGGNAVGLETALYLANQGTLSPEVLHFLMIHRAEPAEALTQLLDRGHRTVTVLEMTRKVGQDIGASTRWTVMAELKRLGVTIMVDTKAVGISEKGVEVERKRGRDFVPAGTVVLATGSTAQNDLSRKLEGLVPEVHTIGDAREPRNALEAIREGFLAGLKI